MATVSGPRLRNVDYTDLELLHVIDDVANEDGTALGDDIATQLGFRSNGAGKSEGLGSKVASRLSWMRRYGLLVRVGEKPTRWAITEDGYELMRGSLTQSAIKEIDKGPGTQLLIMRELATRSYVHGDFATANAVRREWQHREARRGR